MITGETHLNDARKRHKLTNIASAIRCFHIAIQLRKRCQCFLVGLMLIAQAAHQSATSAGNLLRIERKILLLRHLNGYLYEIVKEFFATEGSATRVCPDFASISPMV